MSKFINSKEAIASSLLLWQDIPTQVSVQETYDLKVWPVTNIFNEGPINFVIPPQPHGMLTNVDIVTKFKMENEDADHNSRYTKLSIINNFANSLWELVEVRLDDRVDIMQSMRNSYAYQTYFNHCLNTESNHADYLFHNELFKMDEGRNKIEAEDNAIFTLTTETISRKLDEIVFNTEDLVNYNYAAKLSSLKKELATKFHTWTTTHSKNPAAGDRALKINSDKHDTTVNSKLQCPLLKTSKCLPANMKIRVSLTKYNDNFLLFVPDNDTFYDKYKVKIEDVHLNVTYYRPRDVILRHIEEQLKQEPAPYFISKPEIIIKPVTHSNRNIRIANLFHDKMPSHAFFCLQKSSDFNGKRDSSPFVFIPFSKFQLHVNGKPHFMDPLEADFQVLDSKTNEKSWIYNGEYYRQLYRTIGKDLKGDCLINSKNFHLNFMAAVSFTADRSNTSSRYLNLQQKNSTSLEIDMGYNTGIPDDMILIIYALFDRQIQIDSDRSVTIIE